MSRLFWLRLPLAQEFVALPVPTQDLICLESGGYDVKPMASLILEINGDTRTVSGVSNVRELLQYLRIEEGPVAVEVNHQIIHRREWDSTPLGNRDRVEIVQFVGGG